MRNIWILPALFLTLALACNKDKQAEFDRDAIQDYLDSNGLNATEHESGIFYIIEEPGSGGSPTLDSKITFRYKVYYLDGVVLDQTEGSETATYQLRDLIKGWHYAIPLLQKGGKGTFFIPSGLAYGGNPPLGVRPNAVLKFEVELVDFQ